jgi:hypothetical protein
MIKPIEVVRRYARDTHIIFASGPMSALMIPRIGAARVKPPTPQPKLRPIANMDPRKWNDLK